MKKTKLGVVFGGMSTENEVSVVSATSVIKNLNKEKYEIFPIFISKDGHWYKINIENFEENNSKNNSKLNYEDSDNLEKNEVLKNKNEIENVFSYLKNMDVIFPVLHGLYGEDGTIQGTFELLKIPYVGCKVLASSIGMDKVYAKCIFEKADLNQTNWVYVQKRGNKYFYIDKEFNEKEIRLEEIVKISTEKLEFPMFVKPSNSGSSVGITKAHNEEELKNAIEIAAKYDRKILIEQGVNGREVECGVLGNGEVKASCVGEIKAADEFYTYDAKYNNSASKTVIPADLPENISEEIRKTAVKAFKAIDGSGLARVDFFVENSTNKVFINEVNTMPGFTSISMYPKLFEASGIKYSDLLDKLIDLALEKNK